MLRAALAGALALSFVPFAAAQTVPPGMAARTELHVIDTLTLSDSQFLKGGYKDPCVELNPHVGYDAAATEAAKKSVKELLSAIFKLEQRSDANH